MAQINKLFKPPGCISLDGEEPHPYFKRPGKGHNHDCCDFCGEGGALICCDSCPASFHLQCHDPPLEDLDIPEGDWICIRCFAAKPESQKQIEKARSKLKVAVKEPPAATSTSTTSNTTSTSTTSTSTSSSAVVPGSDKEWRPGGKGKKIEVSKPVRATRTLKKKMYADNSTEDEESEKEEEPSEELEPPTSRGTYKELYVEHIINKPTITSKPFLALLNAVSNENPVEFELPKDINLPEKFPYTWKWSTDEKRQRLDVDSRQVLCYICGRSVRAGPLVSCDYCPLSFHL